MSKGKKQNTQKLELTSATLIILGSWDLGNSLGMFAEKRIKKKLYWNIIGAKKAMMSKRYNFQKARHTQKMLSIQNNNH